MKKTLTTILACIMFVMGYSQSYTYEAESFEDAVWNSATKTSNPILSTTGEWTVAKNNIQSSVIQAQDGTFSIILASKSNALITPSLDNGVGILTYYVAKSTGGGRTITVSTSTDKTTWSSAVDEFTVLTEWSQRRVEINNPDVRYIKFDVNSNGGVHLDNIRITSAGATNVSVVTSPASDITQTSAVVGGTVSIDGLTQILSRGICYNTTGFPDTSSDKVEVLGTTGEFTATLDNLQQGTTYYVKAYAVTASGVNYGEEISFSTRSNDAPLAYWVQSFNDTNQFPSTKPETPVEIDVPGQGIWIYMGAYKNTNPVNIPDKSVASLRMVKNGSYVITPLLEDGVSTISFDEGRGERSLTVYTSTDGGAKWDMQGVVVTLKKEANIITVNNPLVNRIKIANESGGDADIDNLGVTVYPNGNAPAVTTTTATNIGKNTALSGGKVTTEGSKAVVERGICWSISSTPLIADHRTIDGNGAGNYTSNLTDLPAGKLIYYRAYARSRAGTGYGQIFSFTTEAASIPIVTTTTAQSVTGETAISGGIVSDNGGASIIEQGVCWSTTEEPSLNDNKTTDSGDAGTFSSKITGLLPNTQYFYRAYATNDAGTGYGTVETFTTGNVSLPSVTTSEITSIFSFKAIGGGTITDNGNAPIISGLCFNETGNPTINDKKTVIEDVEGIFESTIGNLKSSTTYFIRAYVTNSAGTSYGNEISFTTTASKILYVSSEGNDATADGSKDKPFYSVQNAIDLVSAGDTIYMQGGTYNYSTRINIKNVGAPDGGAICLFTQKGERALLDFSSMPLDANNQGIRVSGSYWHIYGLDIKGAGDNGMLIERNKPVGGSYEDIKNNTHEANHNTIEFCSFFENKDTGLQMKNMAEYNRVINCDSYYNCDPDNGDADGFAPKLTVGNGNYFYGCRAWNNSDDGWDGLLTATENGFSDDMTTVIENCWAFNNGFLKDGSAGKGNGNGFKLGGSGDMDQRHNMILKRCLAFDNLMKGFDQNHNAGSMTLINCTGYSSKYLANKNHFTYKLDEDILAPGKEITLINCVAVWDGQTDPNKSANAPCRLANWLNYVTTDILTSPSDYVTVNPIGVTAPRNADGSLPEIDFMQISPDNSKLIDKGTIIDGIEYNGLNPDLGCFETKKTTGIEDVYISPKGSELLVYPQPATVQFTVKVLSGSDTGRYTINIFDLSGKKIFYKTFYGDEIIVERGNINSGVYIIHITDDVSGQKFNSKLIMK